jgi:chorismate-pyruvate lyase
LIGLLQEFYPGDPGLAPFEMMTVTADLLPQPERSLLVHDRDMTSTLTRFHKDELQLDVLDRRMHDDHLARHIVLRTVSEHRPVEYGAIRIRLGGLEEGVRSKILEGMQPLGGILNEHKVGYASCPGGFFKIRATDLMADVLELTEPTWLYGRCNCLSAAGGGNIAEVVEILPPEHSRMRTSGETCKTTKQS